FAVAANPSLYRDPLGFAAPMFQRRWVTLEAQSVIFFGDAFQTFGQRLSAFVRGLFWSNDAISRVTCAATAALACAGALRLKARARRGGARTLILAVQAAGWCSLTLCTYRISWVHYLLPAVPFACLLAAV